MKEIRVKIYGILNLTKKQFLTLYISLGIIFLTLIIFYIFYDVPFSQTDSLAVTFLKQNFWAFWLFFLFWLIIEGMFFWIKFSKKYLEVIMKQKKELQENAKMILMQNEELQAQTEELMLQKEEISASMNEISARDEKILEQYQLLKNQQYKMTESINYARRIQNAIMPLKEQIDAFFPENFIFWKPQEIVSGDFFWFHKINNDLAAIAVADCTGHGVPGAFMSMLGTAFLNEVVRNRITLNAAQILEELRVLIKNALHQNENPASPPDGMDIALCIVDKRKKTVQFAGANSSLVVIRKDFNEQQFKESALRSISTLSDNNCVLIDIKGDRNPIGIYFKEKPFENKTFGYKPEDVIYLFTDGFADQISSEEDKKFKTINFKKLLLEIYKLNISKQSGYLNLVFENWKGSYPQIDDVLVLGFKP